MSNEYKVEVVETNSCNIVTVKKFMAVKDFHTAFDEVFSIINKNNYTVCGPAIAVYHSEEFNLEGMEIECGIVVKETSDKNIRTLEGSLCAKTILKGEYKNFASVYQAIEHFISENKYKIIGAPYELYVVGPASGVEPKDYITEIYFPVER